MSRVGITPNMDYSDILDEQEEMELGPDLQSIDYSHYLLGFVRDPMWVPAWKRNSGPRAFRDYNDPIYDPDYDSRSRIRRYAELRPVWNFPIDKHPEKLKEMEELEGKQVEITGEMQDRWYKKYGKLWKEAIPWLYVFEREETSASAPADARSAWQKRNDEREIQRAKSFTDLLMERVKMTNQAKKQIQQELENTPQDISDEERAELIQRHILPPIKEEELIERGIMDKQDSFEDDNTAFFPWKRPTNVLKNLQSEWDKALIQHKKDELINVGPFPNHILGELDLLNSNPYPRISEDLLHKKCGHSVNGVKLCKVMADARHVEMDSCYDAAQRLVECMAHQFCRNEDWMVKTQCQQAKGTTRLCQVSKNRYAACLAKVIPTHADM